MKHYHEIFIKESFETILELISFSDAVVDIPKLNIRGAKATFNKLDKGGIDIKIENTRDILEGSLDIEVHMGGRTHYIYDLYIHKRATQIEGDPKTRHYTGTLSHYGSASSLKVNINGNFKNDDVVYYRFITPSFKNRMEYHMETESFSYCDTNYRYGKFNFSIGDIKLCMYEVTYNEKYYFLIDSAAPITLDVFSKVCHSTMIGYGLISATFHQDEAFYLASREKEFKTIVALQYQQLRPTITSIFNPIYSNPYGFTRDNDFVKKIGTKLVVVTPEFFSRLCLKIETDENYATLIILVLEANTASLILKPAGYSVALEKITNIIVEENKGLKPITDKNLAKDFKKSLTLVLESYSEKIKALNNPDAMEILQKNINKINNPTNRDKLMKPFALYGITLSKHDIEAIDHRNSFLHGLKVNLEDEDAIETNYLDVFHISLRLNFLINRLILKHMGYKGWQVNHVKVNERNFK